MLFLFIEFFPNLGAQNDWELGGVESKVKGINMNSYYISAIVLSAFSRVISFHLILKHLYEGE